MICIKNRRVYHRDIPRLNKMKTRMVYVTCLHNATRQKKWHNKIKCLHRLWQNRNNLRVSVVYCGYNHMHVVAFNKKINKSSQ